MNPIPPMKNGPPGGGAKASRLKQVLEQLVEESQMPIDQILMELAGKGAPADVGPDAAPPEGEPGMGDELLLEDGGGEEVDDEEER